MPGEMGDGEDNLYEARIGGTMAEAQRDLRERLEKYLEFLNESINEESTKIRSWTLGYSGKEIRKLFEDNPDLRGIKTSLNVYKYAREHLYGLFPEMRPRGDED